MKRASSLAIAAAGIVLVLCACSAPASADKPTPSPATAAPTAATSQLPEFATTGYTLPKGVAAPYNDRVAVDVNTKEVDDTGLVVYRVKATGERADHPVTYAQYGLAALAEYQKTSNPMWLQRAERNAQRLIEMHTVRDGAWWYAYPFDWTYYERTLTAPWWSGMAQGQALSLFARLAAVDVAGPWRDAADRTWASFQQPRSSTDPWSTVVTDGDLWFEEYAGNQPPLMVLNGHLFATFGVWDYWDLTGDKTAATYIDGAATTVLAHMDEIRVPGGPSYYCVQPNYCASPDWQNVGYHPIHIWQLRTMARLTGDPKFTEWADLLQSDYTP